MTTIFKSWEQRFKLLVLFILYVIAPSMIIFHGMVGMFGYFGILTTLLSLIGGLTVCAILIKTTINKIFRNVAGNRVLLTEDTFWPRFLQNGLTDFREYVTGWNLTWWWEKNVAVVNIEFDVSIPIPEFDFTAKNGVKVEHRIKDSTFSFRPDLERLDQLLSLGKTNAERMKEVVSTATSVVTRSASFIGSKNDSDEITSNVKRFSRLVMEHIIIHEQDTLNSIGMKITRVNFADLDEDPIIEKTRTMRLKLESQVETAKSYLESIGVLRAQQTVEQINEAMLIVRILDGDTASHDIRIHGGIGSKVGPSAKILAAAVMNQNNQKQKNKKKGGI